MSADKEILESLSRSTDWMSSLEIPSNWTNMSVDINQLIFFEDEGELSCTGQLMSIMYDY